MKIDLRKLYSFKEVNIEGTLEVPKDLYEKMDVKSINYMNVSGIATVNYENNIEIKCSVDGEIIMPCAISLEDVIVKINTDIEETIEESSLTDEFYLDLFDILWENIVLEIPLRVVKEGIQKKNIQGNGWMLETEE